MSPAELEELRRQLETLTSKGWIRPSTSEFGASVLFVPKGSGVFRMCIDYRGLNKITRKSTEPLPRIDDLLDMVQGCTIFSKVDLKSGYHQIEMAEEDVHKTAFKTRYGTYEYLVMPFGLCNAPGTFQTEMHRIFRPYLDKFMVVYLDDILVFNKTTREHAEHLALVLQSLHDSQYKINKEKSSFGVPSVIYLGHVISGDGLAPEAAKIAAIQDWPQPQTVRDVRSFLGLASYYRKFIRNFSAVAAPLTNLTKKDTPFLWSLHCQMAFARLKQALTRAPVLKLPDPTLPFVLTTDASQYGIGAVLQQDDGNGLRPVEFMSKKIKTQKLQDSTYEKELYALVSALKHWKHFLLGRHFKIFSDHSTLQWLKSQGELNDKLARYIQFIDLFDFELKHKKGCYNKVANALSRRPDFFALISSTHSFGEEVRQTIARLLPQDPTYGPVIRNLQANPSSEPGYAMSSDLLYTYNRGEERLCIPEDQQLRTLLMSECHDARGHFGFLKSYAALSQRFFWKEMWSDMLRYVDTSAEASKKELQEETMHEKSRFNQEFEFINSSLRKKEQEIGAIKQELSQLRAEHKQAEAERKALEIRERSQRAELLRDENVTEMLSDCLRRAGLESSEAASPRLDLPITRRAEGDIEVAQIIDKIVKISPDDRHQIICCNYPSSGHYLVIDVTDLTFWDPIIERVEMEGVADGADAEEEKEEESEEEDSEVGSDDPDYHESEEGEQGEGESGESDSSDERSEEEDKVAAQRRREKAEGKQPVEESDEPAMRLLQGDPARNPEPPREESGGNGVTTTEGSRSRHRRRKCDIEFWGIPYNAVIDSGAIVLAISLRVAERAGRKNDLIMLTEKDQLVSADEEKIKIVGRMTNVAFRLGKVHALGDVVVLDVNTYDVIFGLPALVALRANLDFERRSIVLRNTGGKPYTVPMRLTLRTTINAVSRVSPMMAGTLRMISWNEPAEGEPSTDDAESSDEDDPEILKLVRQRVYYPPPKTIARTMQLTSRKIQRTKSMILGEPLVQISRMVDSLEPPQTLYEGITPLLTRYSDKKHYCDITELPSSLLTMAKEVRLLRLGAEASFLEPPGRFEAETDGLGIKIAAKEVPWQDVCDGITPEGHVAIQEEDAQMMATVFSWRSDHSFISAPPPDLTKQANTKQIDVRIWNQLFELQVPQYVPEEIHQTRGSEFRLIRANFSFLGYVVTRGGLRPDSRKVAAGFKISFLGYVVTRGGLRPDSRKVAAVKEAPVPTSLTQVRAFLGLASYYRRFIKGFAAIARPLTNLLRKDQPLSWDAECQQAFATLKDALATTPILIRPNPSKQFILITDWQPEAISAILAQKGNDGREHVIEYASRTVPDERRNDSSPQGECYAIVWGIQHFHPYLYGQKFRLVTDHKPLLELKKLTNYTGVIGRWVVRLQEYDFDIVHRKTERHGNADGLTRLHRPAKSDAHPRLSYYLMTLAVPDIRPPYWDLWREDFVELSLCLVEVRLTWIEDEAHPPCIEWLELLFIQAWRTNVEGELLAFLFDAVRPDHQELITQELTIPTAQLSDDLPLDIISQDDEHPVPHVLSRTLTPHLQWSACVEGAAERIPPSQRQHLDPRAIRDPAFFRQPTEQFAAIREEEEEEESTGSDENEGGLEESGGSEEVSGENETPEEGSYSEHSEGEQSEKEEDDEEEDEGHEEESAGSEWEAVPEETLRTGTEAEDPEAARKREEIAVGKTELELAGAASLQICDDPNRDPEPPRPEDGNLATTTPAPSARRRSRSPSSPTRPPVRRRTDTGDRPSSPITLSPSP
ncbi:hypothetical protein CBR_g29594 [Chara braunii]|uniref:Reverse transcriptase domain-containing protein n=1 Tax=Chara braunii TaxID=69332 RepID=A0A388LAU8_CHABU|nr:hypothetical protein CBR_g29594 [Chara braunii]|eukprot:GBG79447.1 hypothetical protein CBR_g29594 [Chara braunii]